MATLAEKKETVENITEDLSNAGAVYITNYSGMSVSDMNEMRGAFYKGDISFKVYKNTLMKRAMEQVGGFDELFPHLTEQNGFAFVGEEMAAPAKIIKKFNDDIKKPQFKAALIDGEYYGEEQLETLAAMKSKSEVIGDIAGLLLAPISNVIRALQSPGETLAGAVKTIAGKDE